jgi:tripartite-type tricarboxylate transporter receptor subunit TctC
MSFDLGISRRTLLASSMALAAALALPAAQAQQAPAAWPTKPLRIIVGFTAGSATDSIARVLAEHLRVKLGQPVTVENRPGANGVLGVTEVARAPADGYTLLATNSSSMTVNPQVYKKITYQPERDFAPVTMVVSAPFIITVNPTGERTASVNTIADLVAVARAKPGQLTYGSGGPGNLAHLGFELINNRAGIKTTHVPYKSGRVGTARPVGQGNRHAAGHAGDRAQHQVRQAEGARGDHRPAPGRICPKCRR